MTVVLDGAGGLFTRIGAIYRWIKENRATAAGNASAGQWQYELADLYEEYVGAPNAVQAAIEQLQPSLVNATSTLEQFNAVLQAAAQATLIEMVAADSPLPEHTVAEALRVLIEQMAGATEDVAANTVTVTATAGSSNVGDGILISDDLDEYGRQLECALAEEIVFHRNPDFQQFTGRGEVSASSRLASNWPQGSGANFVVDVTDAQQDQGILVNGSFEEITANVPDGWSLITGSAGTHIKEETVTFLAGTKAIEFDGDGSNLTQIRQDIAGGVEARTPFAVGFFAKVDVVPAAGVLTIDLYDGTNVIQDDQGNNQSFTVSLPVLTTDWLGIGRLFRIADPKPENVYLRIRLSTALSNTTSLFLDNFTAVDAERSYAGGPFAAVIAGGTEFAADDTFGIDVANNRASVYQEAFEVLIGTPELGQIIPTDGSPTITNSLPTY